MFPSLLQQNDISLHDGECVYPVSPAFLLGLVAAVLVLLAVSSIAVCSGCCCKRHDGVSTKSFMLGIIFATISW
jgi:hypothetical protein